jgi:hypothetical protein
MLAQLKHHSVRIVIAVAFFLFGFFVVANAVDLGDRDILTGLLAGLIGGATILATVIRQERILAYSSPLEC